MKRTEHLQFCDICINREYETRKGTICGLTNDIADFEDTCHSFAEDFEYKAELDLKTIKNDIDYKSASLGKRFLNNLIDTIFFQLCLNIVSWVLFLLFSITGISTDELTVFLNENKTIASVFIISIAILLFMSYFIILEYKIGRTIGKYITKTKVVTEIGEQPNLKSIIIRTFCRLIPFDSLSFLFKDGEGWHDTISKTKVINI